ncbi:hypothetical protein BH09PSE5_BH09PSE5_45970 [soil metagenome]
MKTYNVEIQKIKGMSNGHGLVVAQIDGVVLPATRQDGTEPSSSISMSEATARVLMAVLKTQLTQIDGKKARSQR